jgi:hypothetical protein
MLPCHALDEARKALDDAREFSLGGKFKEALERHIWFHNQALEKEPTYYGVRLSFALSDWVALGRKHPEAARGAHEGIFSAEMVRVITVMERTGDKEKAADFRKKALTILDSPAIRDALKP